MTTYFTKDGRIGLAILRKAKHSPKDCANQLGMIKSSITRELARNTDKDGVYRGASAHKKYLARRIAAKQPSKKIENDQILRAYIRRRLRQRDSPEQIAGRIRLKKTHQDISHETIYQWIFLEAPELKKQLRRISKRGKYRRRRGTQIREKHREESKIRRIDTRPALVETRERIGDYEGDTMVGKDKTKRLVTNVERKSGYGMIDKLDLVSMETMHGTLEKRFHKIPKAKKHTYTYDNGVELGKEDKELEGKLKMDVYRAYPYHSWERGSNENFNGLVRDFFPKGADFATVSERDVRMVERNLNNRPRKRLGYLTPREVFSGATQI